MSSFSKAHTQFTLDLFQQLGKSKEENVFYSPFSITAALRLLLLGSKGNTAQQIREVGVSFIVLMFLNFSVTQLLDVVHA